MSSTLRLPAKAPKPRAAHHQLNRTLLRPPVQLTLDGTTPFRHAHALLVPDQGGVYLIHDLRGVLYVGLSCELRRRFHEHFWVADNEVLLVARRHPFGEIQFSWIAEEDEHARADLEAKLICWLLPACNRLIPNNR